MRINSYPSIYAIGHRAVVDMFNSPVVVEEKIDGSQFSFGRYDGTLLCRSKGQELVVDAPEKMFAKAVATAGSLDLHDGWTYRAEYLQSPKHNTLAYARTPNRFLMVFDIVTAPETYLTPFEKRAECERIGLECVPCYAEGQLVSPQHGGTWLHALLDNESVLGGVKIEGVVVKNYAMFTPDKKIAIAKYVSEAFKEKHLHDWKKSNPTQADIITQLITELKTDARWNKAIQHLRDEGKLVGDPTDIGPLMKELAADASKEESDYIKDRLFFHFWGQIKRGINSGFPEYYKTQIGIMP